MIIDTYEDTKRFLRVRKLIEECRFFLRYERIILLPIPTSKDGVHIKDSEVKLDDVLDFEDGKNVLVVGYGLDGKTVENLTRVGTSVVDLAKSERFLSENGRLTAEGALNLLLSNGKKSPNDMKIALVGYGRIGKELLKMLINLGAKVTVFSTKLSTRLALCRYSVDTVETTADADISGYDFVVNTAPVSIFQPNEDNKDVKILELASGENFSGFMNVTKCPNLPGRMFPQSQGDLIFKTAKNILTLED